MTRGVFGQSSPLWDSFSLFSFVRVPIDQAVEIRKQQLPEVTTDSKEKENKEEIKYTIQAGR